ncbi:MAG: hypothetical protein RSD47_08805 [Romboutsia sp.]
MVKNVKIFEREKVEISEWAPIVIAKANNEVKETLVLNIKGVSINVNDGLSIEQPKALKEVNERCL